MIYDTHPTTGNTNAHDKDYLYCPYNFINYINAVKLLTLPIHVTWPQHLRKLQDGLLNANLLYTVFLNVVNNDINVTKKG